MSVRVIRAWGVARVVETRADKTIVIDEQFIPPNLNGSAVAKLHGFLNELQELLNTRSEATKARKPLAAAEVVVEEVKSNPGYYSSRFYLRPHYQLEGLTVSLRLVSKLPSVKG